MDKKISFKILTENCGDFVKDFPKAGVDEKLMMVYQLIKIYDEHKEYKVNEMNKSPLIRECPDAEKKYNFIIKAVTEFLKEVSSLKDEEGEYLPVASEAQTYIGICYEYGILSYPQDSFTAFNYFNMASRDGNAFSIYKVGTCYEKGVGKLKCDEKASTYYRLSAKLGLVESLHVYGASLLYGYMGLDPDPSEGFFYLKMAAKNADKLYPYPCFDLAQIFEGKIVKGVQDINYAFEIYTRGAMLGCHNCQNKLGKVFEYGQLNRPKNIGVALSWYKKAAENGHTDSQIAMSAFYYTGYRGLVEKNIELSLFWAKKAALKGDHQSAFTVAEFIENGIGGQKNIFLALYWYNISFHIGNKKAEFKVRDLEKKLESKKRNVEKGFFSFFNPFK